MTIRRRCVLVLLVAFANGCSSVVVEYPAPPLPGPKEAPELYLPPVVQEYRFQAGDSLAVRSYYDAQLNQEVMVRPDGRVSLLLLGEMSVAGMTPAQLASEVRQRYRRLVGDTDLTVAVVRSAGQNVYVSGEIKLPSLLPIEGNMTLLQAIARVGGTLSSASTQSVLLIRNRDDGTMSVSKVDLERVLRSESPDVYLQPRDVVHVPKSPIAQTGQFVDQYINAIVPRFVQLQLGWFTTRTTNSNSTVQVIP